MAVEKGNDSNVFQEDSIAPGGNCATLTVNLRVAVTLRRTLKSTLFMNHSADIISSVFLFPHCFLLLGLLA